jgi:hypothetical protein
MICEHLRGVEQLLTSRGAREIYRGSPWTQRCREWVYFDTVLDLDALRAKLDLGAEVIEHVNRDRRSGTERGFVCTVHDDAVMGWLDAPPVAQGGRRRD